MPFADAALGGALTIDGILDGESIDITVPAGTQPGQIVTIRGHGMPRVNSGVRGNPARPLWR